MTIPTRNRAVVRNRKNDARLADSVRADASRLACELFPRSRKVYCVPVRWVSRARQGWAFTEVALLMLAAGPEGAQRAAAWVQSVADGLCEGTEVCIKTLALKAQQTNAEDVVATHQLDPECEQSKAMVIAAKEKDIATDRQLLAVLRAGRLA